MKAKPHILFLSISIFFISSVKAQDTIVYTLQKCIDIALQNNLSLSMSKNQKDISEASLWQSRASLLPSISAYANQGMSNGKSINPFTNTFINQEVNTGQYGINGSLNLFSGLSNFNNIQQNAYNYKAGTFDVEQSKIDNSIQVIFAYLQIISNQELLKQAQLQLEVTQIQVSRLNSLENNSAISPSILYDIKGQLANDKINLVNTKSALNTAKLNLAQLLNMNFTSNSKFQYIEIPSEIQSEAINSETIYAQAIKNYPSIKSAEYRKKSALKNLHSSYGLISPSLNLYANLGSNYSSAAFFQKRIGSEDIATDDYVTINGVSSNVISPQDKYQFDKISFKEQVNNNLNSYIGLNLQINIFNSLKSKTQIKIAQINYKQSQEQQKNTETRFKSEIEQITNDLLISKEKYEILKEQVTNYAESFRIGNSKFEKGALTILEFITAKSNYEKSKTTLIACQYDYILRKKVLDIYTFGKL